jgi:hypothetical protein
MRGRILAEHHSPSKAPLAAAGLAIASETRYEERRRRDMTGRRRLPPRVWCVAMKQALETDRKKREAILHQIQQLLYERVRFGPIYEYI